MGNEQSSQVDQAPGMETNQGKMARPPIVRYNIRAEDSNSLAKTKNLIMP